jgi:hypothetical protein
MARADDETPGLVSDRVIGGIFERAEGWSDT